MASRKTSRTYRLAKSFDNPLVQNKKLYGQDFEKLRENCFKTGQMFEDPEFPPRDSSLYFSRKPHRTFEWIRASTLSETPNFVVDGISRFDIKQGEIGNCWFLAAIGDLTMNEELFDKVVPKDQSLQKEYAGIFHFRFWQYGEWIDVVVDDFLPTRKGQLVFMHSQSKNEFWSSLLEKAYAKLHGSYEALKSGMAGDALVDFTGGCSEMYDIKNEIDPLNLFSLLKKALKQNSFAACSIKSHSNEKEVELDNGLIKGHAYSITKLLSLQDSSTTLLVRIRNPWGKTEWNGAWSDGSEEWNSISEVKRKSIGLIFENDGEFWMSCEDFHENWDTLEVCNISPDSGDCESLSRGFRWHVKSIIDRWIPGESAGGCRNNIETFASNPQFRFVLEDPDEDDDEDKCNIVISLMQKERRSLREEGLDALNIGFKIYHLKNPNDLPIPLNENFFRKNTAVKGFKGHKLYTNLREVTDRFTLYPGTYCIIPSTFEPYQYGDFYLRIFTEAKIIPGD